MALLFFVCLTEKAPHDFFFFLIMLFSGRESMEMDSKSNLSARHCRQISVSLRSWSETKGTEWKGQKKKKKVRPGRWGRETVVLVLFCSFDLFCFRADSASESGRKQETETQVMEEPFCFKAILCKFQLLACHLENWSPFWSWLSLITCKSYYEIISLLNGKLILYWKR